MSAATRDTAFRSFCIPTGLSLASALRLFEQVAIGDCRAHRLRDINGQRRRRLRLAAHSGSRTVYLGFINIFHLVAQAPRLGEESSTVPCVLFAEAKMDTQERQIVDDLFDRLREAERQSGHLCS